MAYVVIEISKTYVAKFKLQTNAIFVLCSILEMVRELYIYISIRNDMICINLQLLLICAKMTKVVCKNDLFFLQI